MQLYPRKKNSFFGPEVSKNDFQFLQQLGGGSFGNVFLVSHKQSNEQYAMKCIDVSKGRKNISLQTVKKTTANEIQILYRLQHPKIVTLFDHFYQQKTVCLVMECLGKKCLYDITLNQPDKKKKKIGLNNVARIGIDILDGLIYMHSQGVINRDIKLQNVMVDQKFCATIIDLSCANYYGQNYLRRTKIGTTQYNSPQYYCNALQNDRIDIWAFGVLLYQSIFLDQPFPSLAHQVSVKNHEYKKSNSQLFDKDMKDLFDRIFTAQQKRISAKQCRNHRWFKKYCPQAFSDQPLIQSQAAIKYRNILESSIVFFQQMNERRIKQIKNHEQFLKMMQNE